MKQRPCLRRHPVPTPATCPVCRRLVTDRKYQELWGEPITIEPHKAAPVAIRLPCIYEGRILSKCPHGDESRDKHWCDLLGGAVTRGGICKGCDKYQAPVPESRRHLLYFIYPVAGNSVWQCNVDQILERIDLFNGKRVVAIAKQNGLVNHRRERRGQRPPHRVDPPQHVRDRMAGHGIEFIEIDNNGKIGEVAAFEPLWSRVSEFTTPGDATFYAHAKGVTRPVNPGVSVHPWTSLLYGANLDHWPVVQDLLTRHPIVGAMKTVGKAALYSGGWHYSGTFFWFRNDAVFSRDWRRIDRVYGGIESWPGVQFTPEESGCVFWQEAIQRRVTGYDFPRLRMVMVEYKKWSDANAQHRRPGAINNPWMLRHGYE